jgi:hypothetical protein
MHHPPFNDVSVLLWISWITCMFGGMPGIDYLPIFLLGLAFGEVEALAFVEVAALAFSVGTALPLSNRLSNVTVERGRRTPFRQVYQSMVG